MSGGRVGGAAVDEPAAGGGFIVGEFVEEDVVVVKGWP
jgi:hypothetical protein